MSLNLFKRTAPESESDSEEELPQKRGRTFEDKYKDLLQNEIDKRILRPKKLKKRKLATVRKSQNLLDKCEKKLQNAPKLSNEEKIKILSSRSLPSKYLSLFKKDPET